MNKLNKKLLFLGCLIASVSLQAQNGVKSRLSANELKILSTQKRAPKPVITEVKKQAAKENAQASAVFLARAILHKKFPGSYPLDLKNEGEKRASEAVNKLPASLIERAGNNLVGLIADPGKKTAVFGKFQGVDFRMNVISPFMKTKGWTVTANTRPPLKLAGEDKFRFLFRKLVCVDECDPENDSDQMIVGGVLVGPGENVRLANSLVSCAFEGGESCDHHDYFFGGFPLNPASTFPQTFLCIVVLAKTEDPDLQAQTAELNAAIQSIIVSTFNTSSNPVDIAYGLEFSLNIMMSIYTNEKVFPAETLSFTLSNANSLGADNQSDELSTGNIEDYGGKYKVKYLWKRSD